MERRKHRVQRVMQEEEREEIISQEERFTTALHQSLLGELQPYSQVYLLRKRRTTSFELVASPHRLLGCIVLICAFLSVLTFSPSLFSSRLVHVVTIYNTPSRKCPSLSKLST